MDTLMPALAPRGFIPASVLEEMGLVAVEALDPSIYLAMQMLAGGAPTEARRLWARYAETPTHLRRAHVPAFVGALAAALRAGVRRIGPAETDLAIVAASKRRRNSHWRAGPHGGRNG